MSQERDDKFIAQVKQQLERHAEGVDEPTAARLQAMRRRALGGARQAHFSGWLPGGLAAAAAVLVVVVFWSLTPGDPDMLPVDADTLAQVEDLELLEDLEFYAWLEDTHNGG